MPQEKKKHSIDSFFTFLLLLSFLLFSLLLAGIGSSIYRHGADSLNENYTSRTALSYISEKVRQSDRDGNVFLSSVGYSPALCLRDVREKETFLTYIYYYDGALRELFTREETHAVPEMGSPIVELSGCTFYLNEPVPGETGQILTVYVSDLSGNDHLLLVHPSSRVSED